MEILFATRPSALARWQTRWVMQALQSAHPGLVCREYVLTTQGDRILDRPLPEIGGKGLFTQELEAELLAGRVQAAVHSLKDLPVQAAPGLAVGAVPERAEARDALVSAGKRCLADLPHQALVGTSSLRRAAQLRAARPDLRIESLRGNVDTRLRKAQEALYDAIVLAGAGLERLGLTDQITEWLPLGLMLPAPGQGALAVQCRADDAQTLALLAAIEHAPSRAAVNAERAFLAGLGGGCAAPVAAYAQVEAGETALQARVLSPDGHNRIDLTGRDADPLTLGRRLASQALSLGAADLLGRASPL